MPDTLVGSWAESVCAAIDEVTPNLRAEIDRDDHQAALSARREHLTELSAAWGGELTDLVGELGTVPVPFVAQPVHAEFVDMYQRVIDALNDAAPKWGSAETSDEFDAAVLDLSRQVEIEYIVFVFATDDAAPDVLAALEGVGCSVEDPLGEWELTEAVDITVR